MERAEELEELDVVDSVLIELVDNELIHLVDG